MNSPAATSALLDLLEARFALRVLWALRDGHRQTFRLLQDSVGQITPSTLNARLKDLRTAGLVEHGEGGYALTALGKELLKRLKDLPAFAGQWQAQRQAPAAAPTDAAARPGRRAPGSARR